MARIGGEKFTQNQIASQNQAPPKATSDKKRATLVRQDAQRAVGSSSSQTKIKKVEKPTWSPKHQQQIDQFIALLADAKAKLKEICKQANELYKAMRGLEPKAKDALYQGVQNLPSPEKATVFEHTVAAENNGKLKQGPVIYLATAKQAAASASTAQHDQPKPPSTPNPSMVKSSPPTIKGTHGQSAIPPNPLEGKELRNWTSEGIGAMQTFLFALTQDDLKAKVASFMALRAVIRQVTDLTGHPDVEELEGWIKFALEDRSKEDVEKIIESMKGDLGIRGGIFNFVCGRLLPSAEALLRHNEDYWEAKWNERGKAQAKQFVKTLQNGNFVDMKNAFWDPERGKSPRLYEIITQKTKGRDPAQERPALNEWFAEALKGCSDDDLIKIEKNLFAEFGAIGGVFEEVKRALSLNINERRHAHEFVQTALKKGDIVLAAKKFEQHSSFFKLGSTKQRALMSALLSEMLSTLDTVQKSTLRTNLIYESSYSAVTELRRCLGMIDDKAVEKWFAELAGDKSAADKARLLKLFRLTEDQLGHLTTEESNSRIEAALKGRSPAEQIAIARGFAGSSQTETPVGHNILNSLKQKVALPVASSHFIRELLQNRVDASVLSTQEQLISMSDYYSGGLGISKEKEVGEISPHLEAALKELNLDQLDQLENIDLEAVKNFTLVKLLPDAIKKERATKLLLPQPLTSKVTAPEPQTSESRKRGVAATNNLFDALLKSEDPKTLELAFFGPFVPKDKSKLYHVLKEVVKETAQYDVPDLSVWSKTAFIQRSEKDLSTISRRLDLIETDSPIFLAAKDTLQKDIKQHISHMKAAFKEKMQFIT